MADNSNSANFGRIFVQYIKPTLKGDRINIPVLCGSPSQFVNCYLTRGQVIDLVERLTECIDKSKKGE